MANEVSTVVKTPKEAIEAIRKAHPEEAKILEDTLNLSIIRLATDEVFALRDKNGEIRAFRQSLTLSEKDGTLIQPGPSGPFVVSAQGYEVWLEAAGACVIFPSEVLVDGTWKENPAVIRDKNNGRILMIYARAVAFRFSTKGIPMVSDWTTIYDTPSYRMIDLLGKAKQFPQAFKLLPSDMKPEEKNNATWAKYPFDEATNLWMNTTHDEALKWLGSIINREKKSIDFAQTFAKRNALKHLSGIQKAPSNVWTFAVVSWRPTSGNVIKWDATQYAQLQKRVGDMISGDREEFAQIELKQGKEAVSEDAATTAAIMESDTNPEDILPGAETERKPEQPSDIPEELGEELPVEDQKVMKNLKMTFDLFPGEFEAVCKKKNLDPAKISIEEAKQIYREVSAMVEG